MVMDSKSVENAASTLLILAADRTMITDSHMGSLTSSGSAVKASKQPSLESRKANKPLMEKRRRARINKSLNELKSILMESMERNAPGHSKWEKADILEMTVQYLHCLSNQRKASKSDPLAVGQFIAGYSECVRQVQKFASARNSHFPCEIQEKLSEHLLSYLKTFSDDATRSLQAPILASRCASTPVSNLGSSETLSGSTASGEFSSPSRQSTLSNFSTPSPSPDAESMDSEDAHQTFLLFSSERDMNNNAHAFLRGNAHERNSGTNVNGVWRPW